MNLVKSNIQARQHTQLERTHALMTERQHVALRAGVEPRVAVVSGR